MTAHEIDFLSRFRVQAKLGRGRSQFLFRARFLLWPGRFCNVSVTRGRPYLSEIARGGAPAPGYFRAHGLHGFFAAHGLQGF
ncbi:MAG TPA: hypothetical protein DDZ83_18750, partial [Nitrospinae bacterium]|nr:hypothetical protein [Nitrospinota bacterium]